MNSNSFNKYQLALMIMLINNNDYDFIFEAFRLHFNFVPQQILSVIDKLREQEYIEYDYKTKKFYTSSEGLKHIKELGLNGISFEEILTVHYEVDETKLKYKSVKLNNSIINIPDIESIEQIKNMFFESNNISLEEYKFKNVYKYSVKKKNGTEREIYAPSYEYKMNLKWIKEKILDTLPISEVVHGYTKGRSIVTNAKVHQTNKEFWLLNLDYENFFPSIKRRNIFKIFTEFEYNTEVSDFLSDFCTVNNSIAQGFTTSPILSNLYMYEIDAGISKFSTNNGIKYTRYADDLTFL